MERPRAAAIQGGVLMLLHVYPLRAGRPQRSRNASLTALASTEKLSRSMQSRLGQLVADAI